MIIQEQYLLDNGFAIESETFSLPQQKWIKMFKKDRIYIPLMEGLILFIKTTNEGGMAWYHDINEFAKLDGLIKQCQ